MTKTSNETPSTPTKAKRQPISPFCSPSKDRKGSAKQLQVRKLDFDDVEDPCRERIAKVYRAINRFTGRHGGSDATGTIYGEVSEASFEKIVQFMKINCELDHSSTLIDIGAGLGKPSFHAAQHGIRLSFGIECQPGRFKLSMVNLLAAMNDAAADVANPIMGHTNFMVGDITQATTMDPFTHVYQFDLGFEPTLHAKIAKTFDASQSAQYLISYRRPKEMAKYGYKLRLMEECGEGGRVVTHMHGSGEGHTCYFYQRTTQPPRMPAESCAVLHLPARAELPHEADRKVWCDQYFLPGCALAADTEGLLLHEHAAAFAAEYFTTGIQTRSGTRATE